MRLLSLFCSLFRDAVNKSDYVVPKFLERSQNITDNISSQIIMGTNFW
jgi:hypothetical protein